MSNKKHGCPKGHIYLDNEWIKDTCVPFGKKVRDDNSHLCHGIFRHWQEEYGIKDGGVDPGWLMELDRQMKKGLVTVGMLSARVQDYYEIMTRRI